ncbi:MAG: undecaprenyl/decaprenyl-phosphate alpha-N-acetylglucosaminyl 1-phosphate transferase [Prolixibacteraceae bacterium]|nr:undecaprenyl/decaprenyl-phosphate alpha-N-acetylglucosaminyl 1-phosphate transferase [Prolixibacteraceae bacterium]
MEIVLTLGAFVIGFILVILAVPAIVRVSNAKSLFEPFEERKIHSKIAPPMGGVAIFIGFTLSSIIATDGLIFDSLKYIIASVILMFFIGMKDDLMNISARKKLVVQIFAGIILITLGNVRFTNLHGIFGVHDIGYVVSLIISLFTMVVIINAFNLIDGIDGLASGLAILAASTFGVWFFLLGNTQFAILSFALVGSLSGFFLYNVFGHKNKLFMGDTGSLIIGLVVSAMTVKFNEFNIYDVSAFTIEAAPSVSFAILTVPLVDTLRVMTIRILQKRSPFSPDKNHIHHRLLALFPSHLKVTSIIVSTNALLIVFALFLNQILTSNNLQLLIVFSVGVLVSFIPSITLNIKTLKKQRLEKLQIR